MEFEDFEEVDPLQKLCIKCLFRYYSRNIQHARDVLVKLPSYVLVDLSDFAWDEMFRLFNEEFFRTLSLIGDVLNQRKYSHPPKMLSLQDICSAKVIRTCSYLTRREVYILFSYFPKCFLPYFRNYYPANRTWKKLITCVTREIVNREMLNMPFSPTR